MKKIKIIIPIIAVTIIALTLFCCTVINPLPPSHPEPPNNAQVNEILVGLQALVEAQHTFYVHVKQNERFAQNVKELGSRESSSGTVMHLRTWYASDAVDSTQQKPVYNYVYKIITEKFGSGKKDGFLAIAHPIHSDWEWPVYIAEVKTAKGGLLQILSQKIYQFANKKTVEEINKFLDKPSIESNVLDNLIDDKNTPPNIISNFNIKEN